MVILMSRGIHLRGRSIVISAASCRAYSDRRVMIRRQRRRATALAVSRCIVATLQLVEVDWSQDVRPGRGRPMVRILIGCT